MGIIFDSYCDGILWLGQVKCVLFSLMLANLEAGNHYHQVLQLEPFEVLHHKVNGVGSGVFSDDTCISYTHYNVIYLFCYIMDSISIYG